MKNLKSLNLGKSLNREEMKKIGGGFKTWCRRRSSNVYWDGGFPDYGYMNPFGCWIYPGMDPNSMP